MQSTDLHVCIKLRWLHFLFQLTSSVHSATATLTTAAILYARLRVLVQSTDLHVSIKLRWLHVLFRSAANVHGTIATIASIPGLDAWM